MLKLLTNAQLYSPTHQGKVDLLIANKTILAIASDIELATNVAVEVFDCTGYILCPGFVDSLTHLTGGGGEGGFATRTPAMQLSDAILGGVTTVTGALGTDAVGRTHAELLAQVKSLNEQGWSAHFYSGSYHLPCSTLTGSIAQDIQFIQECIGIGEIAISDHRGSQPSWQELARVASQARVAGMCAKKSGIVSIHVGASKSQLDPLFQVAEYSDIPLAQFYPTHINRNAELLNEGIRFAKAGGTIDFTASTTAQILAAGEVKCASAFKQALAQGINPKQITFSTDGHASLPLFNEQGELISLQVGQMTSMLNEFRDAVFDEKISIATALQPVTENPARILGLSQKGIVRTGADADLLLFNPDDLSLHSVMAMGEWFMRDGDIIKKGMFEK